MKTTKPAVRPKDVQPEYAFGLRSNYTYFNVAFARSGKIHYRDFPVRLSLPAPEGKYRPDDRLALRDQRGRTLPAVIRPMTQWPDGSVRVWELFFAADMDQGERRAFEVIRGGSRPAPTAKRKAFLREPSAFVLSVQLEDGTLLRRTLAFPAPAAGAAAVCGVPCDFGRVKSGEYTAFKGALIRKTWDWYAGAEFTIRLINHAPGETLRVKSVCLECDLPGAGVVEYAVKQEAIVVGRPRLVTSATPFDVHADAAGIHVTSPAQLGETESDYPPYERGAYLGSVSSWMALRDRQATWLLVVPEARERMPKGWSIQGRRAILDLHPADAEPLRWRQGMALFQRFVLARLPAEVAWDECESAGLAWLRPPIVELDPDVYRAAGWRIPFRFDPERYPRTEYWFHYLFDFTWTCGTFEWGDIHNPPARAENLEYDFPAVAAREYARTGRARMLNLCRAAAEHMMYTDFVACSADVWKEGGIAHHSKDHTGGSCYPSHMWAEGLALYYLLSGDRYALEVARRVGDFFLKYIAGRWEVVFGPSAREMGWTLIALGGLYDVTREPRYLDGIKRIVDATLACRPDEFFPTNPGFCFGVAIRGLEHVRPFYRTAEIARFILKLLDFLMEHRRNKLGLYGYWYDAEENDEMSWIQTYMGLALNIGYRLSGDEKYLESAWRQYMANLDGAPLTVQPFGTVPNRSWAAGYQITWMEALQSFAEKGWLDSLQYPPPPRGGGNRTTP
jgi:hypothetical protein